MKPLKLGYIISLPRSGSTVLSAMLDRKQGIVSPPESAFPQVLGRIGRTERLDKRWMAALYIASTFPPTQLSLEESEACMEGDDATILSNIGRAIAGKLARNPDEVECVVWKTPRNVGMHAGPLSTNGRFIILRRHPHNVYESQFRVEFGEKNRNPLRFAVFRESYEWAFERLPSERCLNVEYDDLPGVLPDILKHFGVEDRGNWKSSLSSLDLASEAFYWMREATKEFVNTDKEKRRRLDKGKVRRLDACMRLVRPMRPLLGPLRRHFDGLSYEWCIDRARRILANEENKTDAGTKARATT